MGTTHSAQADLFTGLHRTAGSNPGGLSEGEGQDDWDSSAAAQLGFQVLELLATDVVASTHNDHNRSQGGAQAALSLEPPQGA